MARTSNTTPTRKELITSLLLQGREMSTRMILFHQILVERFGLYATDHKCLDLAAGSSEGQPITAGRLAELTGLTTGAITGVLDRLERAGFIERQRDSADRRKVLVHVRPDGWRKLAPFFESFSAAMAAIHEDYTTAELELLRDYQARCIQILKEKTDEFREPSATH